MTAINFITTFSVNIIKFTKFRIIEDVIFLLSSNSSFVRPFLYSTGRTVQRCPGQTQPESDDNKPGLASV